METGRHAGLFKVLARRSCHLGFEGCCNIGADERRRRARESVNLHRLLGRRAMEVMTEEVACRGRRQPRTAGARSEERRSDWCRVDNASRPSRSTSWSSTVRFPQARRQLEQRIVKLTSEESPKGRVQMETGEQSTGTANACAASDTTEKLGE